MDLESLVEPTANAAEEAGKVIMNFGALWTEANLEERRKLLLSMLDAVYFDSKKSKTLFAVRPKAVQAHCLQVLLPNEGGVSVSSTRPI